MSSPGISCVVFCLAAGIMLGALFLIIKLLRILFQIGKVGEAVLDMAFCMLCAVISFLCALAVDRGRLRLFQAVFEIIGFISVILAIDPMLSLIAKKINNFFCKVFRFFAKCFGFTMSKKKQKGHKNRKRLTKSEKRRRNKKKGLEKLM